MLSEIMCRRIFQQQRQQDHKEAQLRTHSWSKSCRGGPQGRRTVGGGRLRGRSQNQWPHRHLHHHPARRPRRPLLSLRPVNVQGNRARGMRAPQNTNQFLMHEKYQMQHLRSDSVGSDGGCSSDSDLELTDMDSYLGVLENARGALLDSPEPAGQVMDLHQDGLGHSLGHTIPGHCSPGHSSPGINPGHSLGQQEDSMQYFPSEDDLLQSQNFMQRDFVEFCHFLSP